MRLPPPPVLVLSAVAALAAACASIPLPEREGVALYRAKCSGCHRPYAPQEIKPEKWEETFREMKKKAKLNDAEAEAIRRYVEVDLVPSHVLTSAASRPPDR
jgi:mono/diheme cytochrome c family protein